MANSKLKHGTNRADSIQGHTTLASTLTPAQHTLAEICCSMTSIIWKPLVPGTVALRHQVMMPQVSSGVPQTPPQAQVPRLFSLTLLLPLGSTGSAWFSLPSSAGFALPSLCTVLSGSIFFQKELLANEQDCKCLRVLFREA